METERHGIILTQRLLKIHRSEKRNSLRPWTQVFQWFSVPWHFPPRGEGRPWQSAGDLNDFVKV